MSGYQLTPAADADLDDIWDFVNQQSGAIAADRLEDQLHAAMHELGSMPGIGHVRPDLADEVVRFFTVHSYLIICRPEMRPIQVVRVLHGARDVRAILDSIK